MDLTFEKGVMRLAAENAPEKCLSMLAQINDTLDEVVLEDSPWTSSDKILSHCIAFCYLNVITKKDTLEWLVHNKIIKGLILATAKSLLETMPLALRNSWIDSISRHEMEV